VKGSPRGGVCGVSFLHVENAERGKYYGILFTLSLSCEYIQFEYVRIHVIYRGSQAKYGIYILVVVPQEYVNIYSTRRVSLLNTPRSRCEHAGVKGSPGGGGGGVSWPSTLHHIRNAAG